MKLHSWLARIGEGENVRSLFSLWSLLFFLLAFSSLAYSQSEEEEETTGQKKINLEEFFKNQLPQAKLPIDIPRGDVLSTQITTKKVQVNERMDDYSLNFVKFTYEEKLRTALDLYFDPSSYYASVDIDVRIEESKEIPTIEIETGEPNNSGLPGLPFIPETMIKDRLTQKSELELDAVTKNVKTRINRVTLNLLIDTSYTAEQVDLIRTISFSTLNLKPQRGDEVNIRLYPFPSHNSDLKISLQSANDSIKFFLNEQAELLASSPEELVEDEKLILTGNIWFWMLVVVSTLLLAGLLIILLRRKVKVDDDTPLIVSNSQPNETSSTLPAIKKDFNTGFENESHDQLLKIFIDSPEQMAYLFEQWISMSETKGALKAAQLIHLTDYRFFSILNPYLSKEAYRLIAEVYEAERDNFMELSSIDQHRLRVEFANAINQQSFGSLNEFRFLNFVSNHIILSICDRLSHEETAILIKNLPTEKASQLVKSLSPLIAGRVLFLIGRNGYHNPGAIKQTAKKVFNEYVSANNEIEIKDQNVGSLIKIIEDLPVDNQGSMLRMLSEQDTDLYNKVKKHIYTWDHIFSFSNRVLREALISLDSRTIAYAIIDLSEEHADRLLQIRSDREQQLIMEITANANNVSDSEIEEAKMQIIRNVKSYVLNENRRDALVSENHYDS